MLRDLTQVQIGTETTWGTAVAPTAKLMGVQECEIQPEIETIGFEERRGSLAPVHLSRVAAKTGTASLSLYATYEDIGYWFDSLFGAATPTGIGPYVRTYAGPNGAAPTSPKKFTLVDGQSTDAYCLSGAVVSSYTLSGESGGALEESIEFIGDVVETDSTAALSDRTVNPIMGHQVTISHCTMAEDLAVDGTVLTNLGYSFELAVEAGRLVNRRLGSIGPTGYSEGKYATSLSLVLEFGTASKAFVDEIIATTGSTFEQQFRITATQGTNVITWDFAGYCETAPVLFTDEDGVITVELEMVGQYSSGMGGYFEASVTNDTATYV